MNAPHDADFDKKHLAKSVTLTLSLKQVFLAGIAVGVVSTLAAGFLLSAGEGSGLKNILSGSLDRQPAAKQAAPDDGSAPSPSDLGRPTGAVAPVTKDDHVRGDAKAELTLIEYSDFQCPFCSRFHPTMKQAIDAYPGKVKWVYRHFPLSSIHPDAQKAAEASECAAEQGKFWEMADKMFEKQAQGLGTEQLKAYAKEAGVKDAGKFESCLSGGKYAKRVGDDLASGEAAGVTGTPGTIILKKDGSSQMIPGALPFDAVKQMIDTAL